MNITMAMHRKRIRHQRFSIVTTMKAVLAGRQRTRDLEKKGIFLVISPLDIGLSSTPLTICMIGLTPIR